MTTENTAPGARSGAVTKADLLGLVVGVIVGGFAGAVLPPFLESTRPATQASRTAEQTDRSALALPDAVRRKRARSRLAINNQHVAAESAPVWRGSGEPPPRARHAAGAKG
jgi:hypothetical protein